MGKMLINFNKCVIINVLEKVVHKWLENKLQYVKSWKIVGLEGKCRYQSIVDFSETL